MENKKCSKPPTSYVYYFIVVMFTNLAFTTFFSILYGQAVDKRDKTSWAHDMALTKSGTSRDAQNKATKNRKPMP